MSHNALDKFQNPKHYKSMKNKWLDPDQIFSLFWSVKTFRIMKISVFLLLTGIISVFAGNTYSQSALLSIDMDGVAVEKVLSSIEDQSEFYFLYSNKLIDVERKVSIQADNKPVNEVLDRIFRGTDVRYVVVDRQIILSKEDILKMTLDMQKTAAQDIVISGKVLDTNGNPLPGVNIFIKGIY